MFLSHAWHLHQIWSFKRSGLQTVAAVVFDVWFHGAGELWLSRKGTRL